MTTRCWPLIAVAALAGCRDPVLAPIVEVPSETSPGYPFRQGSELDDLLLEIARSGDDLPLAQRRGDPDAPPHLSEVPFGDDLVVHLSGRDAGVIAAYGRTCAIDYPAEGEASEPSPRLYFSLTTNWGTVQQPVEPIRIGGHAFALPDGSALYLGGSGVRSVERFDPLSSSAFEIVDVIAEREGAVLAAIGTAGQSLLVGGHRRGAVDDFVGDLEIIGAQGVVSVAGPLVRDHAAVELEDGSVLVAGGFAGGATNGVTRTAVRYGIGDAGPEEQAELLLGAPRARHTMTRIGDGRVIVVGGLDPFATPVADLEAFQPATDEFVAERAGEVSVARWGHQAIGIETRPGTVAVVIIGGFTGPNGTAAGPAREILAYDPVSGDLSSVQILPDDAAVGEFSLTPLRDGSVLVAGGRDVDGNPVTAAARLRFDSESAQIRYLPTTSLETPRAGHSATLLCDGSVLVVGGTDDPSPAERYNPELRGRR